MEAKLLELIKTTHSAPPKDGLPWRMVDSYFTKDGELVVECDKLREDQMKLRPHLDHESLKAELAEAERQLVKNRKDYQELWQSLQEVKAEFKEFSANPCFRLPKIGDRVRLVRPELHPVKEVVEKLKSIGPVLTVAGFTTYFTGAVGEKWYKANALALVFELDEETEATAFAKIECFDPVVDDDGEAVVK